MLVFRWWFYQYYIKYAEQMNFHVIVCIDSQTEMKLNKNNYWIQEKPLILYYLWVS